MRAPLRRPPAAPGLAAGGCLAWWFAPQKQARPRCARSRLPAAAIMASTMAAMSAAAQPHVAQQLAWRRSRASGRSIAQAPRHVPTCKRAPLAAAGACGRRHPAVLRPSQVHSARRLSAQLRSLRRLPPPPQLPRCQLLCRLPPPPRRASSGCSACVQLARQPLPPQRLWLMQRLLSQQRTHAGQQARSCARMPPRSRMRGCRWSSGLPWCSQGAAWTLRMGRLGTCRRLRRRVGMGLLQVRLGRGLGWVQ